MHSWCKLDSLHEIGVIIYYAKTLRFEGNDGLPEPADRVPNDAIPNVPDFFPILHGMTVAIHLRCMLMK